MEQETITLTVAMIISEYSIDIQEDIFDKHLAFDEPASWINLSARAFRIIAAKAYTTDLNRFEFDKTECLGCASNTANQTLFADSDCGRCTNRTCLTAKQRQHTADICRKMIVENPSVAFAVQPQCTIDDNLIQEIGRRAERYSRRMPARFRNSPKSPILPTIRQIRSINEAMEEFEVDSEMYKSELEVIEEKIASGEYQKIIDLSSGVPEIGYRVLVEEKKASPSAPASGSISKLAKIENPVEKLRAQDTRNKAISIERTVEDVRKMLREEELEPTKQIDPLEEKLMYYIMLDNIRGSNIKTLGINEKHSLSDAQKAAVVENLTPEQKATILRDFIIVNLSDTFGVCPKSELMLQFAGLHFDDRVKQIAKPYNEVYEKRRTSIIQRLRALGAKLEPGKLLRLQRSSGLTSKSRRKPSRSTAA